MHEIDRFGELRAICLVLPSTAAHVELSEAIVVCWHKKDI